MNPHVWWYAARASGIVGWALASAAVLWGLLISSRARTPRPAWTLDLHRFLGGLAVVFTFVHVGALMLDGWLHLRLIEVLVPFASHWKPLPVALGVVALWLLAAVEVTSLLRRRIPRRVWRGVHLASYGLFVLSTVHGVTAGSERSNPVFQWSVLLTAAAVLFLTLVRILAIGAPRRQGASARTATPSPSRLLTSSPGYVRSTGQQVRASVRR